MAFVKILFPLNVLIKNGRNLATFWVCIDIDKIL